MRPPAIAAGVLAVATAAAALAADPARELASLRDLPSRHWLAWEVPASANGTQLCCFEGPGEARSCRLGDLGHNWGTSDATRFPADAALAIYLEVDDGVAGRILAVSTRCPVDARGEDVRRLDDVAPEASVRLLAGLTDPWRHDRSEAALAALAFHADPAATAALTRLASARDGHHDRREQAMFWLGEERGEGGLTALRGLLREPLDEGLAAHAVFAVSRNPGGTGALLDLVRRPEVAPPIRRQALFWLGQSDDPRALAEISRLLAP